ncbi:MAG: GNAT family N-acetyltransferase, partial [Chloroflexota bacterium]
LLRADSPYTLRAFTADDLPAMIDLYNTVHATRPWTFERQANWNRIRPQQTWRAGSEVIILTEGDRLVGYAILPRYTYGQVSRQYVVDELTAENRTVAQHLLAEISARCHQFYLSEFQIREPLDSMVGTVAQAIGCFYRQEFFSAGGILGLILNRQKLLDELEPELRRRLGSGDQTDHAQAFAKLQQGDLIPDDTTLLRLLLGTWSLVEAEVNGTVIPPTYQRICQGWFPGGGTYFLPTPYSHYLDRY